MAQQTLGRPGSQNEDSESGFEPGYDPQSTPAGDPTDPRGDLPAGAAMGSAEDPSGRPRAKRPPVYDEPGSGYDDAYPQRQNETRERLKEAEGEAGTDSRAGGQGKETAASPSDLEDAESGASNLYNAEADDNEESDGLYNSDDPATRRDRARRFLLRNKRKIGFGAGIVGVIAGGGVGLFLILLPLKIEHMVDNLQGTFFASSQQALSTETRNLVKNYMITRVMPGYKSCGSTIKAGCSARKFGTNPVSNMYRSWADARVERQLAEKGIVVEYRRLPGKWYLETPDINKQGIDIGRNGERLGAEIDNHKEIRAALDKTIKDETKWYQVYTRYKWGRYFEKKFGLPRCVVVCRLVGGKDRYDAFHIKYKNKKQAAQLKLVQRVITPHNQTLGIALECLIQDCAAADNHPSGSDGENGTPESDTDKKIREALVAYGGTRLAGVPGDELLTKYKEIEQDGLQKYLIKKALTPIIGETAAGTAGDVLPVAGWINFLAQIVNAGNGASGSLKKLRYEVSGAAMAATFGTWLVFQDEGHTGGTDATVLGSFTDSLGPGTQGAPNGQPTGGTAGAEQTKLYQSVVEGKKFGGNSAAATALLSNPLLGKTYADSLSGATDGRSGEMCNNGHAVPAGQLICNEDFLGGGNSIANGVHDFFNLPGIGVLVPVAQAWQATVGQVFNFAGDIAGTAFKALLAPLDASCHVPGVSTVNGYCGLKSEAEKVIPQIVEGVTKWLIPDPLGVPMGGGRQFVMGAGGADLTGNDSCYRTLGCQAISDKQAAKIRTAQKQAEQYDFSQQPLFARMFSTSSQYSLLSRLAMDVPFGNQAIVHASFASLLDPFRSLGNGFASIFSGRAGAAVDAQPDPFGITQYGYPPGSIPGDPEKYWDSHCSDNAAHAYQKTNAWNEAAAHHNDPNTGAPLAKTTNPCLLIKATVGAAGGLYDTSNLTQDDLADLQGSTGGTVPAATGSLPTGSAQDLAKQLVPYVNKGKIQCLSSGCPDIVNTANGKSIKTGACLVDSLQPGLLGLLVGLAQMGHTFILSALCSDHSTPDGITLHQGGRAADFNTIDGVFMGPSATTPWSGAKIKVGEKLDQDAASLIPNKKQLQFGQVGAGSGYPACHPAWSFQSGYTTYPDGCHHQHLAVEPG